MDNREELEKQEQSFADSHTLEDLVIGGLCIDGGHHKQWYLEQIAARVGIEIPAEIQGEGIAP